MARKRGSTNRDDDERQSADAQAAETGSEPDALPAWPPTVQLDTGLPYPEPGMTGGYLVLMREDAVDAAAETLTRVSGLEVVSEDDAVARSTIAAPPPNTAYMFEEIGVAVVDTPLDHLDDVRSMSAAESGILAVEPERVIYPLDADWRSGRTPGSRSGADGLSMQYLRGFRDAANCLFDGLAGVDQLSEVAEAAAVWDETEVTWGLQATNVIASRYSGRGIKVAVLDTGLDLEHPDFAGRPIVSESFIAGEVVQDGHGHGTHCIGTACGSRQPGQLPRYGVAPDADIFAGKVLSDRGSGADRSILAGIRWAIRNGCDLVSMSLGAPMLPGQRYSEVYETVANRALRRGTLIIAAAGNDSYRPDVIRPISHPANCPSIMAVGALDQRLQVAGFSNGTANPGVDIAAPGVAVRSSWPQPILYRSINGTSMATPHVAGIAALIAEAYPGARGAELARRLLGSVRPVGGGAAAVGRGLVQAL